MGRFKPLTECENCGSIWSIGTEEHDWQKCSSCGWQPGQPVEEYNEDDDDLDFGFEGNDDGDDDFRDGSLDY